MADIIDEFAGDIAPEPEGKGLRFSQGLLTNWNSLTFENTLDWRGTTLRDVAVLPGVDALSFAPGDVVGLIGWSPGGGVNNWMIIGNMSVPPLETPVSIRSGNLLVTDSSNIVVQDGGSIFVLDGGDVEVDGGRIYARSGERNRFIAISEGEIQFGTDSSGEITSELFFSPTTDAVRWDLFGSGSLALRERNATGTGLILSLSAELTPGIFSSTHSFGVDHTVLAHTTTSDPVSAVIQVNGLIQRNSSSRRYKQDIEDFHVNPRTVLDLKPRTWRDKGEVEKDPRTDRWNVGFIAEEVDEIGLTPFISYNDGGEPEAVNYDRLTVALLELVKQQQQQIDTLTAWARTQGYEPPATPDVTPTKLPKRMPAPTPPVSEEPRAAHAPEEETP